MSVSIFSYTWHVTELWPALLLPALYAACRYGLEAGAAAGALGAVAMVVMGSAPAAEQAFRSAFLVAVPALAGFLCDQERRRAARRARRLLGELRGAQLGEYLSWSLFQLREYLITVTTVAAGVHAAGPTEKTERLQRIIGELNTKASRLLGDRSALTTAQGAASFDVGTLARECAAEARAAFGGGPLSVVVEGTAPTAGSERQAVRAALLAVLQNALERGGAATLTVRAAGGKAQLELVDRAGGFAADESVFEPFFAAKKGGGLGLGLPMARRVLQRLGGDMRLKALEGGTAVLLEFPLSRELPKIVNEDSTWAGRRHQA